MTEELPEGFKGLVNAEIEAQVQAAELRAQFVNGLEKLSPEQLEVLSDYFKDAFLNYSSSRTEVDVTTVAIEMLWGFVKDKIAWNEIGEHEQFDDS